MRSITLRATRTTKVDQMRKKISFFKTTKNQQINNHIIQQLLNYLLFIY